MKLVVASIAVLLALAVPALAAGGEPGSVGLDRSFGDRGTALMPVAGEGAPPAGTPANSGVSYAAAVDGRGRVVLGGRIVFKGGALVRFLRDGTFDRSFGDDGVAAQMGGRASPFGALAVDAAGRLVATSLPRPTAFLPQRLAVARYLSDGRLDRSFAAAGVAQVAVPTEVGNMAEGVRRMARSIAIDDRGRITVAWVKTARTSARNGTGFLIARFDEDGGLDESFGRGGFFTAKLSHSTPFRLAYAGTDAAGRKAIVVATTFAPASKSARREVRRFEVVRLSLDGTLDPSFGGDDGIVQTVVGRFGATAMVAGLDTEGRIVVGGVGHRRFGFARLLADGSLDPSFGSRGRVAIPASRRFGVPDLRALAIDGRDRVVVSGRAALGGVNNDDFGALRLRADGQLDRGFGRAGTCIASFRGHQAYSTAVSPVGDGDVILSGVAERPDPDVYPPTAGRAPIIALAKCAGRP
jgi:uncharacterized delta-60 repeat protein